MSEAKLCKDCKHYEPVVASPKAGGIVRPEACNHPNNIHLVRGGPHKAPYELRYSSYSGACQESGLWWEHRTG